MFAGKPHSHRQQQRQGTNVVHNPRQQYDGAHQYQELKQQVFTHFQHLIGDNIHHP